MDKKPESMIIALPYKELKTLEKLWLKRINKTSGFLYGYAKKELIKSFMKDLREIANKTLEEFK